MSLENFREEIKIYTKVQREGIRVTATRKIRENLEIG